MVYRRVRAGKAWDWTVSGWRLFIANPGVWILLYLLYLVIDYGLPLIPALGPLALSLLSPALTAGLLFAAHEQDHQRPVRVVQLFQALQDPTAAGRILVLGLIGVVFKLISIAAGITSLSGMLVAAYTGRLDASSFLPALAAAGVFGLLVAITLGLVLAMMFYYAVPLVMLDAAAPLEAIKSSVAACTVNILPLTVLSLINLGLLAITALSLGLGILVTGPVMIGSLYAGYKDVYRLSD